MTTTEHTSRSTDRAIISEPATSPAWWFLGTLAVLRNPQGSPRTPVVMELTIPPGGSPPLHVHEKLDDSFLLLDGEVVVRCGDDTVVAKPGSYVVMPKGVEHTFRVRSQVPARMLLVHADDSFLSFIEAVGEPTTEHRLPPPGDGGLDFDVIAGASAAHGAPMIGPSLEEDEARSFVKQTTGEPSLGAIHHISLNVTDLPASERWYTNTFGLIRVDGEIAEDGTGHIVLLSPTGGWILTLASADSAEVEHLALACAGRDQLLQWHEQLAARGVEVGTVTDAPYGSGFVLRDPDGIDVELFAPPSQLA